MKRRKIVDCEDKTSIKRESGMKGNLAKGCTIAKSKRRKIEYWPNREKNSEELRKRKRKIEPGKNQLENSLIGNSAIT